MYAARPRKSLLIGEVVKSRVHPGDGDCTLKIEDIYRDRSHSTFKEEILLALCAWSPQHHAMARWRSRCTTLGIAWRCLRG